MSDTTPLLPPLPRLLPRDLCPACGERASTPLLDLPYDHPALADYLRRHYGGRAATRFLPDRYTLRQCAACGLAYQSWVPDGPLLADIYDRWIPASACTALREAYDLPRYADWAAEVRLMIELLDRPPHALRALDFGFGWAEWSRMAMAWGVDVAGCELSQERIAHARRLGVEILDLDALPDEGFDFINTEQVFEHLIDPAPLLQRLIASLRPGGIIKLSVPNARGALRKIAAGAGFERLGPDEIMPIAPLEHINAFTPESLRRFAERAGLTALRPPLTALYRSQSGGAGLRQRLRLALRPIYRHYWPGSTFAYFTRPAR